MRTDLLYMILRRKLLQQVQEYRNLGVKAGIRSIYYNAARVLSSTDDEIIFAYLIPAMHEEHTMVTGKAALKYEDGWKCDWNLEYSDDDEFLDFMRYGDKT